MKKVLLTSTAIVAFAGAAAAEVTITGSAEMGVVGGSDLATQFFQDVDVKFTMTGETDGGLSFGAAVDLDEAGNLGNEFSNQGVAIFVSGGFGTLTMGDTDGALDFVLTDAGNIGNPGSIADDETSHIGYLGSYLDGSGTADNQVVRYDYSFGDFAVAVSMEQNPQGADGFVVDGQDDPDEDDVNYAIGGSYATEFAGAAVSVGLGYQHAENGGPSVDDFFAFDSSTPGDDLTIVGTDDRVDAIGLGATFTLDSGFTAGFTYTGFDFEEDAVDDASHVGIGMGYAFDAFSVHFNYGLYNFDIDGVGEFDVQGYGIAAGYDLGGGASLLFGYGRSELDSDLDDDFADTVVDSSDDDFDTFSLGLSMAF
ncbi:porin [Roseicyclus sp. F158]|uniref:Porin n=1 Tax=Tropicimonas omnivorans TaxID=3075590 RepID=A0ABU3DBY2_9RHOB|nr:porin [Roseicyclus sp. F158]MDT0681216.1 porin [Roseicyclus sp. F158]